jgi:hypothetical protein
LLAFGECYQESVTSSNSKADIREIADLQKLVKSVGRFVQFCSKPKLITVGMTPEAKVKAQ